MDPLALLKRVANTSLALAVAPLVAAYRAEQALLPEARRDPAFQAWSQALSALPGYSGQYLRRAFYMAVLPECDTHSCVQWGSVFSSREVYLGQGVYIGARCMVGRARLEKHVTIGSNVDILSGKRQHNFEDPLTPIQQQGGRYELVTIGENSWIGNGAVVLADVGKRCIVAAGAVVIERVPDDTIVGGNPARVIKRRPGTAPAATANADS